jgi:hypothetical protein
MRKPAFNSDKRFEEMVEIYSPDLVTDTKKPLKLTNGMAS